MDETIPNERLVALQVAEGKTNKEAAAALFLSPHPHANSWINPPGRSWRRRAAVVRVLRSSVTLLPSGGASWRARCGRCSL
jgi:hypothetical protein